MNKDKETFDEENINKDENINTSDDTSNEDETAKKQQEKTLEDEYADLKDRNLRLFAEFENFKKRSNKEKLDLYKSANESLLVDLLPVLDDFDRGINLLKTEEGESEELRGMELIQHKFLTILEGKGLKAIETEAGDDFDIELHEAITQIPAPSEDLRGKIVDIVETGYMLNDKVIRFTKVVVGK
ncbi:nucleotide exchange factor GrpE [Flavobacteriaceae bacterium Ap0902]|nr:nucleotide exchange factor GrpE [Flavobacteriaceae bacterium Ap0902]